MPTPTWDLIEEKVLASAQASVTFSSIPQTYKDLVLECIVQNVAGGNVSMRFNGDTGSNYSATALYGTGSAAQSSRETNATSGIMDYVGTPPTSGSFNVEIAQLFSYANTNVNKSWISRAGNAASGVDALAGLWRSTAAITTILVFPRSTSFNTNSVFRLWGVA